VPLEHPSSPRGALVHAWVGFLSRWEWDCFGTFTVDPSRMLNELTMHRTWEYYIRRLNRTLYGRDWEKKIQDGIRGVNWVRAIEYSKKGVPHYHALLGNVGTLAPRELQGRWSTLAGFAKINPVRDKNAAYTYCAKYVLKGGGIDVGGGMHQAFVESDHGPDSAFSR